MLAFGSLVQMSQEFVTNQVGFYALGIFILLVISVIYFLKTSSQLQINLPSYIFNGESDPEVLIIGSGVLGSALAARLARDGRKITVIERDLKEPDRIVGELLQPGGLRALKKLGLGDCVDGLDAHTTKGYVIHDLDSSSKVQIPYPKDDNNNIMTGRAFHHGRFIMALRKAAMAEKNVTYIEGTASKLINDNGVIIGAEYKEKETGNLKKVFAPLTVVADGCFSRFRKELVKVKVTTTSQFVGMLMEDCSQTIPSHAEVVLTKPSPILVYQVSRHYTRILVDVRGNVKGTMRDHMLENIAPQLPDNLRLPFVNSVQNGRIRAMPNSCLPPAPIEKPGVLAVGDAFNMRHPLTGGGMSVAFNDCIILKDVLKSIPDLRNYQAVVDALRVFRIRRNSSHSFVVNILAQALYELFAADSDTLMCLRRACFAYFQLGGACVAGPVGLLSVLYPKPHILLGHFFAVALYAIVFVFKSEPWWAVHRSIFKSIRILRSACEVIFPLIWREIRTLLSAHSLRTSFFRFKY